MMKFNTVCHLVVICLAMLVSSSATFAQAKPDRSGEAALIALFEQYGAMKGIHLYAEKSSRNDENSVFEPAFDIELTYLDSTRYQILKNSYWADHQMHTVEKGVYRFDPMDLGNTVVIQDAPEFLYQLSPSLNIGGDTSMMIYFFLAGKKGMDELVSKDHHVLVKTSGKRTEYTFSNKSAGIITVKTVLEGKQQVIQQIEYSNLAYYESLAQLYPDWVTVPKSPWTIERYSYAIRKPKKLKEITLPSTQRVLDQRKKKSA